MPLAPQGVADGVHIHYCGCDIKTQSVVEVSTGSDVHVVSDEHATAWEDLYLSSFPSQGIRTELLGARITRDADGTVWCDQSKYINTVSERMDSLIRKGRLS